MTYSDVTEISCFSIKLGIEWAKAVAQEDEDIAVDSVQHKAGNK